ncbi:TPA: YihY/virulence factor BrkB family protein [Streptococcus suis]
MKKTSWKSKCLDFISSFFAFYQSAELELTSVAVAYYLIISIFPILMTLGSLLPYLSIDVTQILTILEDLFPASLYPSVVHIVTNVLTQPSNTWLGFSILTTLWTISKSMSVLQKAVNKAYGVSKHRDFIIGRLVGIFLGIGLQIIITLGALILAFGNSLAQLLTRQFGIESKLWTSLVSQSQYLALIVLFVALLMLYFFLPNVRIRKIRYVLPGAIFVVLTLGTVGRLFGLYVDAYANKLLDFRFVTSVIFLVLMLWFVFMANLLIVGAVLNASYQSRKVEEFTARDGDFVSILNRIKARFTNVDET